MKNKIFIVMILQLIIMGLISIKTNVMAYDTEIISSVAIADAVKNPADDPDSYKPKNMTNADKVKDKGNKIIGVIQFVGSFASVICLAVIGIKYMTGSVEERAEYKKTMMPYIIGSFMLFGITTLLGFIKDITDGVF